MRTTVHAQELLRAIDRSLTALEASLRRGHSEEFRAYLRVMARFHRYSSRNVWLILRQRPGARLVAGHVRWRSLGRHVRQGERGIAILAPTTRRRLDASSGREERHIEGFHVARVWDLEQTDGRPLPDYIGAGIDGQLDPDTLRRALETPPVPVRFAAIRGDGETDGREIRLAPDLSPARTLVALAHEWAHVLLHFRPESDGADLPAEARELEAEGTAYVVAAHFGIADRSGCDYILSYGGSAESLERRIERIRWASGTILEHLRVPVGAEDSGLRDHLTENAFPLLPESGPLGEGTCEAGASAGGLEEHLDIAPPGGPFGVTPREAGLGGEEDLTVPALGIGLPGEKRLLATAEDRARIGDARTQLEERACLPVVEERSVGRDFGARADERHAPREDIDELRPFVDLGAPKPGSDPGDSGVPPDREGGPSHPRSHGAEFVKREATAAASEPLLAVENRASVRTEDDESDDEGRQRQGDQQDERQDDVTSPGTPHRR